MAATLAPAQPTPAEAAALVVERARDDPLWFVRNVLGYDTWSGQEAILRALARPGARVAVKACHSVGKTVVAAAATIWRAATGGQAITTAPTWTQVEMLLWTRLHWLHGRARYPLGGRLNKVSWELAPDIYAMGLSTDRGVRFQGFHGDLLVVLDEANGVRPDIWEAIEGMRAGGDVRVLAIGNPTIPAGPFYDAFAKPTSGWTTFTIDAFATPNLAGLTVDSLRELPEAELDRNVRPYLVTRRWVREVLAEWGEDSPLWQSRVRAQFPRQAADALIWIADLEAAALRAAEDDGGPVTAGIDVAGAGEDETVICVRAGAAILLIATTTLPDARGWALAALQPYRDRLALCLVDSVGVGHYFVEHLRDAGLPVRAVNVGAATGQPKRFANLKAELYWGLRERFQAGAVAGLTDQRTLGQLAGIRYRQNGRGQIEIERKEELRRRGAPSPDRAEAVMLAFAELPQGFASSARVVVEDARARHRAALVAVGGARDHGGDPRYA